MKGNPVNSDKESSPVDVGFERILMPNATRLVSFAPQNLFRVDRMFIERCSGVKLESVKVGNQSQMAFEHGEDGVSTVFYSVPSSPKTIDRMRKLIAEKHGMNPENEELDFAWDEQCDPDAALGLPVKFATAEVGNLITFRFNNKSHDPVRLTVVLRGRFGP